jgi:hypothetical protein
MDEMIGQAGELFLFAVVPSFAIASVVMAVTVLGLGAKQSGLGAAVGLAAGVGVTLWYHSLLALVPGEHSWNRLTWLALAALWIGRLARMPEMQPHAGWPLRGAMALATAWLVLPISLRAELDWLAPVFAAVIFVLWTLLERLCEETPGGTVPFLLALTALVAGGVLIHASIKSYLDVTVMLAAALAGLGVVAAWRRVDIAGAVPAFAVLLPGLLLMGQQNTSVENLSWYVFALPVLAPLLLVETLPLKHWSCRRLFLVRLLLTLIPLAAALALAHVQAPLGLGETEAEW